MCIPMEKTVYVSSRIPLHRFDLNDLKWGCRKVLQTKPKTSNNNWTPVLKPCLKVKAKQHKKQAVSRPANKKVLEVVRERRVRRRREGLFSLSLRKEEVENDFIRVIGTVPERKMKVKEFDNAEEKRKYDNYQKYLKEIVPGNWLSEIYSV